MPSLSKILAGLKLALMTWLESRTPIVPVVPVSPPPIPPAPVNSTPGYKLYLLAYSKLGTDVSPDHLAKDELGCAESVSALLHEAYGDVPNGILGTYDLRKVLASHPKFVLVAPGEMSRPGDVVICVTGEGKNANMPHGHTGIMGKQWIMSTDSGTGKFIANYTPNQWSERFGYRGGYPIHVYRRKA